MGESGKPAVLTNAIPYIRNFDAEWKEILLRFECAALFFVLPVGLYWLRHLLAFKLMPILLLLALGCLIYLWTDKTFDRTALWNARPFISPIKQILVTFTGVAFFLAIFTFLFFEHRLFVFPINRPHAALTFALMYPLLGALPQEIIFKSFFFHRYRNLFPGSRSLILLNGLSFGLYHLWYANIIAPVFSVFAGMILAYRYLKTRSLVLITIEHSLLGIFLYFVGLGWFFYSGSIR